MHHLAAPIPARGAHFRGAATRNRLAALTLSAGLAGLAVACAVEPTQPPDPETPIAPVACDEQAPLTLLRLDADSAQDQPAWLQVCTLCPVNSLVFRAQTEEGEPMSLETGWAESETCALALPSEPLPATGALNVAVDVVAGSRSGTWSFSHRLPEAIGSTPEELGTGTYRLASDEANLRIPARNKVPDPGAGAGDDDDSTGDDDSVGDDDDSANGEEPPRPVLLDQDLLLRLGKTTPQGTRPLAFGLAQSETDLQDLCAATAAWSEPAQLGAAGQFAAAAGPEENYPTSFGRSLARGAVQGRLSSDGAYLLQLSLLAVIDLSQEEAKTGVPPTEACAQWATSLGYDPCGPCGPPADGVVGTPTCITTLWEWALAPRTETSLIPIDSPGPDCPEGEDL